jgi:Predicted peptidase
MKNYYLLTRSGFVAFVVLLCSFQIGFAQSYPTQNAVQSPLSTYVKGYYEWLPADYQSNATKKYPLIVFIHGIGECGNGTTQLSKVLVNGPPKLIQQQKFPTSFTVNGQEFSFIVISPQFTGQWRDAPVFNEMLNNIKAKYRVDENRIYLTGLSMGGGILWHYSIANQQYANGLAAMAVVCGNMNASKPGATILANANLPIKIFHNDGDPTVSVTWSQNWYNSLMGVVPAMTPRPQLTIFNSASHDAWSKAYDPNYKENNLNIYEWMLTQTRGSSGTPVNEPPVVAAGIDQTITLPVNTVTLNATATDADGTIAKKEWTKTDGPANFNITSPGNNQTTVTNLEAGTYTFEFSATDDKGATSKDQVVVKVNPAPTGNACKANAGPDQTIVRGEASSAMLDGSGSTGQQLNYRWRLLTSVSSPWKSNLKNADKSKADVMILPHQDGGYKYELTVSNSQGCTSKDTTTIFVDWGKMPPRNSDSKGWHVATAADIAKIPTARIGDLIIDGANNGPISGGPVEINVLSTSQISLKAGQKILIRGGRYRMIRLDFAPGTVRGTRDNPVIITNYDGQVETMGLQISNAVGAKITGKYVPGVSGDVNFQGHDKGNYAFSRGKYGIFANAAWGSLSSSGLRIWGEQTDSLEIEYLEIANGHFTAMMIKDDGSTKDYNNFYIHDLYIHDIHGEGVYIGSTGGDPQHQFNNMRFENVRIVNAGNEIFQFNQIGYGSVVRNNVFINSANNRRSTFANYQDNGAQLGYRAGYQQFRNNILLGAGNNSFNTFVGSKNRQPSANDSIYICNNLIKYGSGNIGGYFKNSDALPTMIVKIDSNYFGGFSFTADQIYSDSRGVNTNTLIKIANGLPVTFRDNKSDGTKSVLTSGGSILSNNAVSAINNPNFVNSGWPASFDFSKLTEWGDFIFNTWKDEFANPTGVKFNSPIVFQAGDYVTFLSKTYRSKVSNNHGHMPQGKTDDYWELVTWSGDGQTYTYPPDDYRLVDGDEYKNRNIGLADIAVQPVPNKPPVADAGVDRSVTLPVDTVKLAGKGTDTDGSIASYEWTKIDGPDNVKITNGSTSTAVLSELDEGVYKFELLVVDNKGASAKDTVVITVHPGNRLPVANAGADRTVTLPVDTIKLAGSGTDADGAIAGYEWSKIAGPNNFQLNDATSATAVVSDLEEGVYEFELVVIDDKGAAAKDTVVITVNAAANKAPVADAGEDKFIELPDNSTVLNGSGSDADGAIASYQWRKISGPASYNLANANSASTQLSNLEEGEYQFELTVTDNKGATAKDTVKVVVAPTPVVPNIAPVANAGTAITITLPQNSTTLNGTGTDSDGAITSYQWRKISGPSSYKIGSPNAATTQVSALTEGTYEFELTVKDDKGASGKDTVKIIVKPAPNKAPTANAGTDITIVLPKNSTELNGSGADSDGTIVSYLWKKISGPASFQIGSPNKAATTVSNLTEGAYQFELTVTDNKGATGKATVKVIVQAAPNKAPTANAGLDVVISLPDNSANLSGRGTDTDGAIVKYQWRKISGPASYTIVSPNSANTDITNLTEGVYEFELTVTDNKGATGKDVVKVTVEKKANKAPVANAGRDTTIAYPANSIVLDGSGSYDADGQIVSYKWTKISGPNLFVILNDKTARPALSSMAAGTYVMELTVTDNEGMSAKDRVSIVVDGKVPDNKVPKANAGADQVITLPLDSARLDGSQSSDEDGYIQSYQWKQKSGPSTAVILNASSATTAVNGLVNGEYVFELTVKDNKGTTSTATVTIKVVNPGGNSNGSLKLYPVPAREDLNFRYDGFIDNKPVAVIVHDERGALVLMKKIGGGQYSVQGTIDVRLFRSGMYYLTLKTEDGSLSVVKKFVVIH